MDIGLLWTLIVAVAVVILGVLDYELTRWGLELGLREQNPVVRRLVAVFGKRWGVVKLGVHFAAAAAVLVLDDPIASTIVAIVLAGYAVVIRNNARRIRDVKGE